MRSIYRSKHRLLKGGNQRHKSGVLISKRKSRRSRHKSRRSSSKKHRLLGGRLEVTRDLRSKRFHKSGLLIKKRKRSRSRR